MASNRLVSWPQTPAQWTAKVKRGFQQRNRVSYITGGAASVGGVSRVQPSAGMSVAEFKAFQAQKAAASRAAEVAKVKEFSAKAGELVEKADADSVKATTAYKRVEAANTKLDRLERERNTAKLTGMTVRVQQLNREIRDTRAEGKGAYLEGRAYSGSAKRKFDAAGQYIESKQVEFEREGISVVGPGEVPLVSTPGIVAPTERIPRTGVDVPVTLTPTQRRLIKEAPPVSFEPAISLAGALLESKERAFGLEVSAAKPRAAAPPRFEPTLESFGMHLGRAAAETFMEPTSVEILYKKVGIPPIVGAPLRFLPPKVAIAAGKSVFAVGGFVGATATKKEIERAEEMVGRPFPYKPEFVAAGEMAGEWATMSFLIKPPKVKLGEFGVIEVTKKKGPRVKLPKILAIEKAPSQLPVPKLKTTFVQKEIPELGEFLRAKGWKPPKPPVLKTTFVQKEISELGKYLKIVGKPRVPKPPVLKTTFVQKEIPELGKVLKGPTVTVQKFVKPTKPLIYKPIVSIKPTPPTTAGLWKVEKPLGPRIKEMKIDFFPLSEATKAEAESIRFLQQQIKAAQIARVPKPVKVAVPKAPLKIPGSYAALARGLSKLIQPTVPKAKPAPLEPFEEFKLAAIIIPKEMKRFAVVPKPRFGEFIKATPRQKEMTKEFEKRIPRAAISIKAALDVVPKIKVKEAEIITEKFVEIEKIKPIEISKQAERIKELTRIVEKPITVPKIVTRMRILTPPKIVTEMRMPPIPKLEIPKEPRKPPPHILLDIPKFKKPTIPKIRMPTGFKLEVRRKGKWELAIPGTFTEKTAKGLAQRFVGGTPLAAFRLKKAYGIPREIPGLPAFKPWQFRKPIRKGKIVPSDVWIEKQAARIDMPGELKGITFKGLETLRLYPALRKKRKKKKKKKRR